MSDYISRKEVLNVMHNIEFGLIPHVLGREIINGLPPVEIVRCKDCKHLYHDADCGLACEYTQMGMREEDYCSYGESEDE